MGQVCHFKRDNANCISYRNGRLEVEFIKDGHPTEYRVEVAVYDKTDTPYNELPDYWHCICGRESFEEVRDELRDFLLSRYHIKYYPELVDFVKSEWHFTEPC